MMKNQLNYIIQDLQSCFDGKPWYGIPVMEKLDSVDWKIVNDKVYGAKSIAVLTQHIIHWRIFVLKKLQGDETYDIVIDGPTDWTTLQINNEQEWESLKQELRQTQVDILKELSERSDGLLSEKVPGKEYTFGPILQSVAQHDIYHLGQIAMLNSESFN